MPNPALAAHFLSGLENLCLFGALSLALGFAAFLSNSVSIAKREFVLSFCFVGHCILFTSAPGGHAWQIDAQMLFFVALEIVPTVGSMAALIYACVLVVTHHLSLSVFLPELVYPGGAVMDNLARTVLHAGIVVLETGCLLVSQMQRRAADAELATKQAEAEAQAKAAAAAEAKATASQKAANEVVETLGDHLGDLVEGKLDCEIETKFTFEYETLRQNFNTTVNALKETIVQVMDVTHGINNGAGEIARASEVRGLAQRSTDAATEIKTLIGDSSRQVETGVDLVSKAGTAIQKIVEQVNHFSGLMSGIAEGASEQANGLNEINTGVSELDRVTQQNAAMVEETTAVGHMLNSDAEKLAGLVTRFQLSSSGTSYSAHSSEDDIFNAA
ncbi:hypothetical protein KMP13_03530 [Epibacterium ulvae]|nr:methyl-accepting chemotaxis protein [Epibacterium ulvae]MBT8152973.1 hypothetical protein [Epibacterium ulvae]